jgi:hypothetical protein
LGASKEAREGNNAVVRPSVTVLFRQKRWNTFENAVLPDCISMNRKMERKASFVFRLFSFFIFEGRTF